MQSVSHRMTGVSIFLNCALREVAVEGTGEAKSEEHQRKKQKDKTRKFYGYCKVLNSHKLNTA